MPDIQRDRQPRYVIPVASGAAHPVAYVLRTI